MGKKRRARGIARRRAGKKKNNKQSSYEILRKEFESFENSSFSSTSEVVQSSECAICERSSVFIQLAPSEKCQLRGPHRTCSECLKNIITNAVCNEQDAIFCPDCLEKVGVKEAKEYLVIYDKTLEKYYSFHQVDCFFCCKKVPSKDIIQYSKDCKHSDIVICKDCIMEKGVEDIKNNKDVLDIACSYDKCKIDLEYIKSQSRDTYCFFKQAYALQRGKVYICNHCGEDLDLITLSKKLRCGACKSEQCRLCMSNHEGECESSGIKKFRESVGWLPKEIMPICPYCLSFKLIGEKDKGKNVTECANQACKKPFYFCCSTEKELIDTKGASGHVQDCIFFRPSLELGENEKIGDKAKPALVDNLMKKDWCAYQ